MEPSTNDEENNAPEPKKPEDNPTPTKIVINSEDGSIMNDTSDEEATPKIDDMPEESAVEEDQPSEEEVESKKDELSESTEDINSEAETSNPDESEEEHEKLDETEDSYSDSAETEVSEEAQEEPEPAMTMGESSDITDSNQPETYDNPMAIPPQPTKKDGAPKAAVIVAVVIALSLAGVTVFAYMKMQKTSSKPKQQAKQSQPTQQTENDPVSSDDIDTATGDIDTEMDKTTNDSDLPTSESVNDQTLGL